MPFGTNLAVFLTFFRKRGVAGGGGVTKKINIRKAFCHKIDKTLIGPNCLDFMVYLSLVIVSTVIRLIFSTFCCNRH